MVTTGTDAKRRQGKGVMEVRYDRGRARAHPTEENEIGEGGRNPCVAPSEAYGAEEWVARSLINTAARFLLRRPSSCFSITLHSPLTFLSLLFLFLLPFPSSRPMSYLSNPHRPYDPPDPPSYSHSQLSPQNARNVLNMSSFDSLSAQHSAQSPDQRLPKVGETRCC
jgi:hypothetical protein